MPTQSEMLRILGCHITGEEMEKPLHRMWVWDCGRTALSLKSRKQAAQCQVRQHDTSYKTQLA